MNAREAARDQPCLIRLFTGWSTTKLLRHARKREMDAAAQAQVERDRVHRLTLLRVADTWRICQRMLLRRLAMERRV